MGGLQHTIVTNMTEHFFVAHFSQGNFAPVAVREQIFHGMHARA
jgi:hypothetical protein